MPHPLVSESTQILQLLTHIQSTEELEDLFTTLQQQLQQDPHPGAALGALLEVRDTWKQIRAKASDLFEMAELLHCLDGYFVALDRRLWLHRKSAAAGGGGAGQPARGGFPESTIATPKNIGTQKDIPAGSGVARKGGGGKPGSSREKRTNATLRLLPFVREEALPAGSGQDTRQDTRQGTQEWVATSGLEPETGSRRGADRELPAKKLPVHELPANELPGNALPGNALPGNVLPTAGTPGTTSITQPSRTQPAAWTPAVVKERDAVHRPEDPVERPCVLLPEQQWVVDDPLRESLLVAAVAGAGKTTTLVHTARARTRQSILYLCFDNAMARKAETVFPRHVRVSTMHALAYRECGVQYRHKLVAGRELTTGTLRDWLSGSPDFTRMSRDVQYSLAGLLYEVIRRFLQTPEKQWKEVHPADLSTATAQRMWGLLSQHGLRLLRDFFCYWWQQAQDPQSRVPISHDVYFKVWVSRCPRLMADLVMLDEAQDTNPLGIALLEGQRVPKVIIGDPHQSIYGWRGAKNALQAFERYRQHRLSTSFRFGQEAGRLAMELLRVKGCEVTVIGNGPETQILPPGDVEGGQTIICRTQAGVLDAIAMCITRRIPFRLPQALAGYLLQEIQPLYHFWRTGQSEHDRYRLFPSWDEYVRCVENLGDREGMARIRLVETRQGELARILESLHMGPEPALAAAPDWVTITTAHRAKGQEFDEVHIWHDFVSLPDEPAPDDEEINLLYMAVTRARRRLFLDTATWTWWQMRRQAAISTPR